MNSRREQALRVALACLPAALVIAVYLQTLPYPYLFDDEALFEIPRLREGLVRAAGEAPFRALTYATYGLDFILWGFRYIAGFRLTNILLHAVVVLMAGLVVTRTSGRRAAGLFAAALVAVHPFLSESLVLVSARADILLTLGLLTILYAASVVWEEPASEASSSRGGRRDALLHGLIIVLAAVTFVTKENAVIAPAGILVWGLALTHSVDESAARRRRNVWLIFGIVGVMAVVMALLRTSLEPDFGIEARRLSLLTHWATQPVILWRTLAAILWPVHLTIYPHVTPVLGYTDPRLYLGITGLVVAGMAGIAAWRVHARATAIGVAFLLTAAPTAIIPLSNPASEHRFYPVAVGVCMLAGWGLGRRRHRPWTWSAAGIVLVALTVLTTAHTPTWSSRWSLWKNAHFNAPGETLPAVNLAQAALQRGDLGRALNLSILVSFREPFNLTARIIRANVYRLNGFVEKALKEINDTAMWYPDDAIVYANRGLIYEAMGDATTAVENYQHAIKLDPQYVEAYVNLSSLYLAGGALEKARDALERARAVNPRSAEVHVNLGIVARRQHNYATARTLLLEAQRLNPTLSEIYYQLAGLAVQEEQWKDALASYKQTLSLSPGDVRALSGLGGVLLKLKRPADAAKTFKECQRLCFQCASCYANRGMALYNMKLYNAAYEEYQRASSLDRENADAYNGMANALRAQGRYGEAIEQYAIALSLAPSAPLYHYNLAGAYAQVGEQQRALKEYYACLQLQPPKALERACSRAYSQLALKAGPNSVP